ncbi:hypothetical protein IU500_01640 [Nocardia terpenica]|uniref:Uncharacterized protein n=2 Tax=Nocardia terpenica TaxID=455432 RepID=A0A164NBI1_9NOCA|nr:hypothetical protein CRH09_22695 [Nocardia terpenica]KZM74183.1 hypothetical protein AWN90_26105 [Nocardia terpenica]MBF6059723.1 hypothetical protein [Nocardia terpenica]MBF6102736.1 hypothetical protein [Nocardia terpenica]MBF6111073.1 hypothetical protein [Nocardia terpenica]
MAEELDDIGRETAALMRQMLQLATLVALRTRERGQKEAEARVKVTEARMKEAKELVLREARESKAKDPRNLELARMLEKPPLEKGVSLEKDRFAAQASAARSAAQAAQASKTLSRYDSVERRTALAAHLARIGIAPELAAVRMLMEVSQAQPPQEAVRTRPEEAPRVTRAREIDARGLSRVR